MTTFDLEPVKLSGEGEYNLDVIKEIRLTESYHELEQNVKGCEDKIDEPFDNCTTKNYINTLMEECRCLPFHIRLSDEVTLCTKKHEIIQLF